MKRHRVHRRRGARRRHSGGQVTPRARPADAGREAAAAAIFGEKASDVKDTSLRVPPGMDGTVIDVRVFTREESRRTQRALAIEKSELERVRKTWPSAAHPGRRLVPTRARMIDGKVAESRSEKLKSGSSIDEAYLSDLPREQWFEIRSRTRRPTRSGDRVRAPEGSAQDVEKRSKRLGGVTPSMPAAPGAGHEAAGVLGVKAR